MPNCIICAAVSLALSPGPFPAFNAACCNIEKLRHTVQWETFERENFHGSVKVAISQNAKAYHRWVQPTQISWRKLLWVALRPQNS